ncbi:hypothetical protein EN851_03410 [Mesorhizobium sp. M8A.F.Ca.ET.208.01.1.1]|uniref:hypothetical protein n=1 Tax=unclassified Mesorhizobium TaxID=325217 RepID=UPI00109368CA|nr:MULTISPECIES: hypothetical protein [unclassified Mesorhizobium]TGQ94616.1 hypothetical protein EN851_03410 [Mesorhizobium sp. M8A.F.Ca.ET.208.01.1.1]TGT55104.1 hypothetical protein EN810_03410 [Mesorhizobium sp. M8A.F.Ca.ET.167.01.1.1]
MAKPAQITIPALVDVDAEYKDLVERSASLNVRIGEIRREIAETEAAIAAEAKTGGPRLRSAVAELVGDADSAAVDRRKKLRDLRHDEHNHSEALDEIQKRIYARRGFASRAVIAAVQSEIDKRVGAIVAATDVALATQADLESLLRDLESEGVETDAVRSAKVPFFLTNGQAARYISDHGGGNG